MDKPSLYALKGELRSAVEEMFTLYKDEEELIKALQGRILYNHLDRLSAIATYLNKKDCSLSIKDLQDISEALKDIEEVIDNRTRKDLEAKSSSLPEE